MWYPSEAIKRCHCFVQEGKIEKNRLGCFQMAKKEKKLSTPAWILEGYDSPAAYEKAKGIKSPKKKVGKTFKVRECPECSSDDVGVVVGHSEGETAKDWECRKCKWIGPDVVEKELTEDELMKYMDKKGEEIA